MGSWRSDSQLILFHWGAIQALGISKKKGQICGRRKHCFCIKNNPPVHSALSVKQFYWKEIPVSEYPPYLPDLALTDFYLVPKVKCWTERFLLVEEVKRNMAELLKDLTSDVWSTVSNNEKYIYSSVYIDIGSIEGDLKWIVI